MPKLIRLTGQMQGYWKPASEEDMEALVGIHELTVSGSKTRTSKQNNSLHQFLQDLADALNAAGLDMKTVLKPEVEIPWTQSSAKEFLWRPIQQVMTGKDSTTEPTTKDYLAVQETLLRHLASKFGVTVEWPCVETQMRKSA